MRGKFSTVLNSKVQLYQNNSNTINSETFKRGKEKLKGHG